jgi:hypothetical protein
VGARYWSGCALGHGGLLDPALERCEVGAGVNARAVFGAERKPAAGKDATQRGTCRQDAFF